MLIGIVAPVVVLAGIGFSASAAHNAEEERKWQHICDGVSITEQCSDTKGTHYSKYIYHEAESEVTEKVVHPAVPAK